MSLVLAVLSLMGGTGGMRYFWIPATALESASSIDSLVGLASDAGASGLIVQVMGRGEAWYLSDLLPEASVTTSFDPLGRIVLDAGRLGLEVHAWVNAFLTWSAPWEPSAPEHVYHAHPDWFMADLSGRSSRAYSRDECEAAGIVGATLSPAVAGVRERLASVCAEIADRYDVDGIHLDYVRYPGTGFGFEPPARAGFFLEHGVDPVDLFPARGRTAAPVSGLGGVWQDWRAGQVTETVRTVRAALRSESPSTLLSCAVMADPRSALSDYGCDWQDWLEEGLVDFVCPMAYTTSASRAGELAVSTTAVRPGRVAYGIAVYNQSLQSASTGARSALLHGAGGICVYSLDTFAPADTAALAALWGTGAPPHGLDAAMFHRTARMPR